MQIDWNNLDKNSDSKEISFESFNFQMAYMKYSHLGDFEYDYNTPGAEFYLTLKKDCDELDSKSKGLVGWQAKFWVNHNDLNNTKMDSKRRTELKIGLLTALKQKPNINAWIICTPGQIETNAKQKLQEELLLIKSDLKVLFWNKPIYEAFYHESHDKLNQIFSHYFSSQFIGYKFLSEYSQMRINCLGEKFDTDLYISTEVDNEIELILDFKRILTGLFSAAHEWQDFLKYSIRRCEQIISDIDTDDKHQIYLANLLKFLLKFAEEFDTQLNVYDGTNNVLNALKNVCKYIHEEILVWNELIKELQLCDGQESDAKKLNGSSLKQETNSQFEFFDKICNLYEKFSQNEIHVFGKAGYGKTNLACAICKKALQQGIPAILILASEIRVESNISKWIIDSLGSKFDLINLLGFLNNLGFLKQTKIPFVIDGLNEIYPNAAIWKTELDYLRQQVRKFKNIIFITTSRDSYVKEIFNKNNYKEIEYNYYLEGFVKYNLSAAINKYFKKYRITISNDNYDKSIFQNPLLLKIFCTVYEGKAFTLHSTNIYETMESYYNFLVNKIADSFLGQRSIMTKIIMDRINNFCYKLLDTNKKNINYKSDFFSIFDPDFEPSNQPKVIISDRVLDEGMFIKREIQNDEEVVEFTHDFIGGYSLAKAIAFGNDNPQEILQKIRNHKVISMIINLKSGEFLHPLSEDILKNLIFFFKKKTGGQLYNELKLDSVLKLTLLMLEVADLSEKEKQDLVDKLVTSDNKDLINSFFDTIILNIVDKNDYLNVDILLRLLERMSASSIDLYWSEAIKRNSSKIVKYLNGFTDKSFKNNKKNQEIAYFVSCLFSSTHRLIRDTATKVLVNVGEYAPEIVFVTCKKMESISDIYISERIIAALCGITLRSGNSFAAKTLEIAKYLEDKYFKKCRTTHLLILDYIDTILHYVSKFCRYKRSYSIDPKQLKGWQKDKQCIKELKEGDKAIWGYGPIFMDFAKYLIGMHLAYDEYSRDKTPSLKECIAMMIWRINELGYDEKLFTEIDKECLKNRNNYSRHDNSESIERYGKKYSWIAFFELYGYFVLKNKVQTEAPNSFRVSAIDIDPTFPILPPKEQLITKCLLPRLAEDRKAWIKRSEKMLFKEIYLLDIQGERWMLLNCKHQQKRKYDVRIDLNINTIIVPKEKAIESLNELNNSKSGHSNFDIEEYHYLFYGEIPWGKLVKMKEANKLFDKFDISSIQSPHAWFSWESYHSRMNDIGSVPFLVKVICDEFNMKYDIKSFTFFNKEGTCTKYYHDNFSHYFFIKEKYIREFLEKYKLSLIWYKSGFKCNDYDLQNEKQFDLSTKWFKAATIYKYGS